MIKPIRLTADGEILSMPKHDKRIENDVLIVKRQPVGRHEYCWGEMYLVPVSESHHVIRCNVCALRVKIELPLEATITYADLRARFVEFNFLPG